MSGQPIEQNTTYTTEGKHEFWGLTGKLIREHERFGFMIHGDDILELIS